MTTTNIIIKTDDDITPDQALARLKQLQADAELVDRLRTAVMQTVCELETMAGDLRRMIQ